MGKMTAHMNGAAQQAALGQRKLAKLVSPAPNGGGKSVLIVDDDPGVRATLSDALAADGYQCTTASSATKALDLMKSQAPDLVISDVRMPGMDGVQLLDLVAQHFPRTSIVLMTGYGSVEDAVTAMRHGASNYIEKPITLNKMRAIVSEAMAQQSAKLKRQGEALAQLKESSPAPDTQSVSVEELAHGLLAALGARLDGARAHALRVADLSERTAIELHLASESRAELRTAALIHDIGKAGLRNSVLEKPEAQLTEEECEHFRTHPAASAHIAESILPLRPMADCLRHHHERYDGTGYPSGLAGRQIPLGSRIIAVANAYDRMVAPPQGERTSPSEALEIIAADSGKAFDPLVCQAFAKVVHQ